MGAAGFIGEGDAHHPASPHPRQGCLQQRIPRWDHHRSIGVQLGGDFTFGLGDRLATAQPADVGGADIGDHRKIGFGAAAEALDFPQPPHTHLHHHRPVISAAAEQGERYADVVVLIAAGGLNRPQGGQGRLNQLAGGGLAGGAGHRHHLQGQLAAPAGGQLLVGQLAVLHPPEVAAGGAGLGRQLLGCCWGKPLWLGEQGAAAGGDRRFQEAMAIEAFADQGHIEVAGLQLAAICANLPEP